jgi:autophagy-related protein 9
MKLSDVVVDHCVSKSVIILTLKSSPCITPLFNRFSGFTLLFFILFTAFYIWQIISFVMSVIRLVDMYNFYTYLLKVPDVSNTFL